MSGTQQYPSSRSHLVFKPSFAKEPADPPNTKLSTGVWRNAYRKGLGYVLARFWISNRQLALAINT